MTIKIQATPWNLLSDQEKTCIQDRKMALYSENFVAELSEDQDYNETFIIHSGCLGQKDNMERFKKRLSYYDQFDLQAPDNKGFEPIFIAIAAKNLEAIELLDKGGVNINRFSTLSYLSPVGYAAYGGHYQSLQKMLDLGCDPFLTMVKEHGGGQTNWGSTVLHRLGRMGRKNQAEVFKVLAPYYPDIMLVNDDGNIPIDLYHKNSELADAFQKEVARRNIKLEKRLKKIGDTEAKGTKKKI